MHRERRYQRHHAVRDRVSTPHKDERRQRNARPDKREDPKQHSEDSAQHDPMPRASQIRQHRSSSHISSFVPRLFTRIECGVFGVGWADQLVAAVRPSTADPASAFGKSTFSPTVSYLAHFTLLRDRNLRTHSPAKRTWRLLHDFFSALPNSGHALRLCGRYSPEFFSRQDAKLAKAPLPPNRFFFAAPTLISPNLAPFAPLREAILLSCLISPARSVSPLTVGRHQDR